MSRCPSCGSSAYIAIFSVECSNTGCELKAPVNEPPTSSQFNVGEQWIMGGVTWVWDGTEWKVMPT